MGINRNEGRNKSTTHLSPEINPPVSKKTPKAKAFEINLDSLDTDKPVNLSEAFKLHKGGLIKKYRDKEVPRSQSKPKVTTFDKLELFRKRKETKTHNIKNARLSAAK